MVNQINPHEERLVMGPKRHRTVRIWACSVSLLFVVGASGPAISAPIYTCTPPSDIAETTFSDNDSTVNVYIQKDIGVEFSQCSVTDDINNWQGYSIVNGAMETWNTQSRGLSFRYRDTFDLVGSDEEDLDDQFCTDSTIATPAVLVWVSRRCDRDGFQCDNTNGNASTCSNDDSRSIIVVYGNDLGSPNDPELDCSPNQGHDFRVDVNATALDFQSLLVHEFGHVIGHGHPASSALLTGGRAVMQQSGQLGTARSAKVGRHLYPYDMECAVDYKPLKEMQYYWRVRDIDAYYEPITTSSTLRTTRNSLSAGHPHLNNVDGLWGIYTQLNNSSPKIHYDNIDTYFFFFDFGSSSGNLYGQRLDSLDISPVIFSTEEFLSSTNNASRIAFANRNTTSQIFSNISPPRWMYLRSDTSFGQSSGTTKGNYHHCTTPNCATKNTVQTSIPLVSAWDPISGRTIAVRVPTNSGLAKHGHIFVHPGTMPGTSWNLRLGTELVPVTNMPSASPYDYELETDTTPGVACSPVQDSNFPFNCMLAWVDRGAPNARVLYTYFRVDTVQNSIVFDDEIRRRSGANTASGVSLAYMPDKTSSSDLNFFMTFKGMSSTNRGDVVIMSKNDNPSSPYSSWTTTTVDRDDVLGAPTWIYDNEDNQRDALIYWAEQD